MTTSTYDSAHRSRDFFPSTWFDGRASREQALWAELHALVVIGAEVWPQWNYLSLKFWWSDRNIKRSFGIAQSVWWAQISVMWSWAQISVSKDWIGIRESVESVDHKKCSRLASGSWSKPSSHPDSKLKVSDSRKFAQSESEPRRETSQLIIEWNYTLE